MSDTQKQTKGLLYITAKSITNVSGRPISSSNLTISLKNKEIRGDDIKSHAKQIGQINDIYQNRSTQVDLISLCYKSDVLELHFKFNQNKLAFITFPLQKLIQMPRVKHTIQCKLIQKQNGNVVKPIKQIVQIQLQIILLNNLLGRLIISGIEAYLTRDTQLVGKMDPYVQIQYLDQVYKTNVKENEGNKCYWDEKIEIPIKIQKTQGMRLRFAVFDMDNFSSDLVGDRMLLLCDENLLLPTQQITKKSFMIQYQGKQAGNITIKYEFQVAPFNF